MGQVRIKEGDQRRHCKTLQQAATTWAEYTLKNPSFYIGLFCGDMGLFRGNIAFVGGDILRFCENIGSRYKSVLRKCRPFVRIPMCLWGGYD